MTSSPGRPAPGSGADDPRDREVRLARLVEDVTHVGSWELDLATGQLHWSRVTHELFGTDPATFHPHVEDAARLPAETWAEVEPRLDALRRHGRRFDVEVPLVRPGHERSWLRISARAEVRGGDVVAVYGTVADVTAEREERLHLERFEEMIELGSDGVWELAADGTTLYVNERMASLLGRRPEQMVGRSALEHFTGRWREAVREWFAAVDASTVDTNQLRFTTATGDTLWANVSIRARTDGEGRVSAVTAMVSDLTALKVAEAELRRREAHLRDFVTLVPLAIVVVRLPDGQVLDANDAAAELLGRPRDALLGRTVEALFVPPPGAGDVLAAVHAGEDRLHVGPAQVEVVHADGSLRTTTCSGVRLVHGDGPALWLVLEDVTERRRLEQLQDRFVATVSHELRTPLTSIHGALELLRRWPALSEDRREQLVDVAVRNSDRLRLLVDDILDLERLGSGALEPTFAPVDLREVAGSAVVAAGAAATAADVEIELRASAPVPVSGDEHLLLQLVGNLLSNAVKFSPPGGAVVVEVTEADGQAVLAVRDHGPGVPAAFRPRLFERFAQADSSDRRERGGTGLGLSIVRTIAVQHGGDVNEEPPADGGARFVVRLPTSDRGRGVPGRSAGSGVDRRP